MCKTPARHELRSKKGAGDPVKRGVIIARLTAACRDFDLGGKEEEWEEEEE